MSVLIKYVRMLLFVIAVLPKGGYSEPKEEGVSQKNIADKALEVLSKSVVMEKLAGFLGSQDFRRLGINRAVTQKVRDVATTVARHYDYGQSVTNKQSRDVFLLKNIERVFPRIFDPAFSPDDTLVLCTSMIASIVYLFPEGVSIEDDMERYAKKSGKTLDTFFEMMRKVNCFFTGRIGCLTCLPVDRVIAVSVYSEKELAMLERYQDVLEMLEVFSYANDLVSFLGKAKRLAAFSHKATIPEEEIPVLFEALSGVSSLKIIVFSQPLTFSCITPFLGKNPLHSFSKVSFFIAQESVAKEEESLAFMDALVSCHGNTLRQVSLGGLFSPSVCVHIGAGLKKMPWLGRVEMEEIFEQAAEAFFEAVGPEARWTLVARHNRKIEAMCKKACPHIKLLGENRNDYKIVQIAP